MSSAETHVFKSPEDIPDGLFLRDTIVLIPGYDNIYIPGYANINSTLGLQGGVSFFVV